MAYRKPLRSRCDVLGAFILPGLVVPVILMFVGIALMLFTKLGMVALSAF